MDNVPEGFPALRTADQADIDGDDDESTGVAKKEPVAAANPEIVGRLGLMVRYHVDAIRFIQQVEDAMPKLNNLLQSTGRAEILEAMDLFKVAHEYQIQAAQVDVHPPVPRSSGVAESLSTHQGGLKAMLHLIWTKDNSTVVADEDGAELKGIRSKVIECYKELFVARVPDMSDKQHVSRVSKNLIS